MKMMIREFFASLRERDELDAILPDLLSELGYTVLSRPGRGTKQYGVDVAATGVDSDGEKKVFLFTVKSGDLTRSEWDGTDQALRPSLGEIQDAYVPNRIPRRLRHLPVVICICIGGEIREQVRDSLTGYIDQHTTDSISFDEWNGDRLADYIIKGILREEILPKEMRSSFQKSVAMIDEPEISYLHFSKLIDHLRSKSSGKLKDNSIIIRQIYVCLWILYVWARDIDNLRSPIKCSELAVLVAWDLVRPSIGSRSNLARSLSLSLNYIIHLHFTINIIFLSEKIIPHTARRHAISQAVSSQESLDINLALFDLLGNIGLVGIWLSWLSERGEDKSDSLNLKKNQLLIAGLELIESNPSLLSPISDYQSTDIGLFLQFVLSTDVVPVEIKTWIASMANCIYFQVKTHGKYPCVYSEYRDLIEHPREKTDTYLKEATSGSTLIPLLYCWLSAFEENEHMSNLKALTEEELSHCTLQFWSPDESSEEGLYIGSHGHGLAFADLNLEQDGTKLLEAVAVACRNEKGFSQLSAISTGYWPIVLLAARHYRLPIPPQFWINALYSPSDSELQK